jgi:hypothetical protein
MSNIDWQMHFRDIPTQHPTIIMIYNDDKMEYRQDEDLHRPQVAPSLLIFPSACWLVPSPLFLMQQCNNFMNDCHILLN